ncbi:flippase-like domain-containing protein [Actinomadura barringtoniae]|uniref:Flippase-like domain-containing protein n=1 Tax=Actinomadura barringtoniae TaxID=1427535 RepID=A0A939PHC9_9ACTN|nr:lysylphosphatidylglycerol synthase transmembrane domain-containing protein [Actinomadura barringtoniae]MBO2452480.1 flippase-like domain-containing protein [Actinomadura barringtoniae]
METTLAPPVRRSVSAPRLAVSAVVAIAVLALAIGQWATVRDGVRALADVDHAWLGAALIVTLATIVASLGISYGSMRVRPSPGRLVTVQFAVTGVAPLPGAGFVVYLRFLRREGLSNGEAVGAFVLMALANGVARAILLAGSILAAPELVHVAASHGQWIFGLTLRHPAVLAAGCTLAVLLAVAAVLAVRAFVVRRGGWRALLAWHADVRAVARNPRRAAMLWLGAFSLPILYTADLYAMLRGLGITLPPGHLLAAYMIMTTLAGMIPSPNGIGSIDVALIAGLTVAGVPATAALAAVLGHRLLTFWAQLVPGMAAFAYLVRRRAI